MPTCNDTFYIPDLYSQLTTANDLASRRGSRVFSNNDLLFQFRHDPARMSRLRTNLAWRAVRKTVRDSEDDGGAELAVLDDPSAAAPDSPMNPALISKHAKIPPVPLPWDITTFFSEQAPDSVAAEDEEDQDHVTALERLRKADEITKGMTLDEYNIWSEYRRSSFTWRKTKRFREWSGLGVIAEHKPTDDVQDILGFLICEMVMKLTDEALVVQRAEKACAERRSDVSVGLRSVECPKPGLFAEIGGKGTERWPIEPRHIRQAFERLQVSPRRSHAMLNGTRLPSRGVLKLVSLVGSLSEL